MELESHFLENQSRIEAWFRSEWRRTPAPFYASVDLRNSGFKVAPVDTNLFPAGFNNLNPAFMPLCVQAVQSALESTCPDAVGVLLVPENHTRNLFYLESISTLAEIIDTAGYEVRIGSMQEDQEEAVVIDLPSGRSVTLEPLRRDGNRIHIRNFSPCAVLLNNDMSAGIPPILRDIEQTIVPPLELGWWQRLKSEHFTEYRQVAAQFSLLVDIDPWLIDPLFRNCGHVDFKKRDGENCLADIVDELLEKIRTKYAEHNIDKEPFVVVKADSGTYGMGIMTVKSGDEMRGLNKKQRNKMASAKGGGQVEHVIVQEGVYTNETIGLEEAVAEPVVYMIDHHVVGGFYRVHTARGASENLNAPGMHFEPLAFHESCITPDKHLPPDEEPNRFYTYGVIARLALLAAARELANEANQ